VDAAAVDFPLCESCSDDAVGGVEVGELRQRKKRRLLTTVTVMTRMASSAENSASLCSSHC